MKKIGIYLVEGKKIGGAWQICLNFLEALKKLDKKKFKIYLFQEENIWSKYTSKNVKKIKVKRNKFAKLLTTIFSRFISNKRLINYFSHLCDSHIKLINKQNCDLIIFPNQDDNSFKVKSKSLTTIWDLMHIYEDRFAEYTKKEKLRRDRKYQRICDHSSVIVTESHTTKRHVIKNYDVNRKKIFVLPLTYPQYLNNPIKYNVKKKYGIKNNYIFYPAQFWEQKNHYNLLLAFKTISEKYKLTLVLSGAKKINYERILDLVNKLNIRNKVKILNFVHEKYMYSLYKNALCVAYVPFTGPTNIPPLEALKVGVPLICSDVYEMKKQVGNNSAIFINPKKPKEIEDAIFKLIKNIKYRRSLISNGKKRIKFISNEKFSKNINKIINYNLNEIIF